MKFSIIIPVFNRPIEIEELLESLTEQTYKEFEVLVVEDGSSLKCEDIVRTFETRLKIRYFYKENSGQGFSRNYGYARANGDYLIVFDSDCLIPPHYLDTVNREIVKLRLDAYGGPDKAHSSFTPVQKAISYAMTSLFSTGGIRGSQKSAEKFRPRSFNMGISRRVYEETQGYRLTRMAEDLEFSIRIEKQFFKIGLIPEAYVYHKRRTNFRQFFKQLHFFGRGRINLAQYYPAEIKWVHLFPSLFLVFCCSLLLTVFLAPGLFFWQIALLLFYVTLIFSDALARTKEIRVAFLSVPAVLVQLTAYGLGFLQEGFYHSSRKTGDNQENLKVS